ncbi:MAG TPA: hypothetical protein VJR89_39960 [Polyangiales bacterium]|nr:hypothetical protein [Polyangiales bacterium]
MAGIATAEEIIDAPLSRAFERFVDYPGWDLWMPAILRPIAGPARALRAGDSVLVYLGEGKRRVRAELNIVRVRPNRELCWRAGVPGLLIGEHSFFFSDAGGATKLRSEEPFSGMLAQWLAARWIERVAEEVGAQILAGFASHMRGVAA